MPSDKIAAAATEGKGKREPKTSKQKTHNAVAYEESKEAVPILPTGKYQIIYLLLSLNKCLTQFCLC